MPEKQKKKVYVPEGNTATALATLCDWLEDIIGLFEGGYFVLEARRAIRHIKQNAAYFGYVVRPVRIALRDAGYHLTKEMIHETFKKECLDVKTDTYVDPITGEVVEFMEKRTTTNLDSTEFYWYVERCKNLEWVKNLQIPFDDERLEKMILNDTMEEA